ncbi:hypothetical protein N7539_002314 [Penicillium diatomitis]|uniref:Zn(2)-C6 fungal-type domain-containing protein n=1 Tax=Penicillium diatomitis TaxID=2819901 RepID=A0A9W9XFQ1_9EURO|nr:uncharacterized protein N7539_002314 [Penicillium diatomitis]KAJ5490747.1 hypothetical protein N7539_002314 [Penicillium diatomitis]
MDLPSATGKPLSSASSFGRAPSSARAPLPGGRQITRNRASYSCHTCRRRKVKCDKIHPICGNCAKTGTECTYDVSALRKVDDRRDGSDQEPHNLKRRRGQSRPSSDGMDDVQSLYARSTETVSSRNPKANPSAIEARLDKLMSMIERIGGSPRSLEEAERQVFAEKSGVDATFTQHLRKGRDITSSRKSSPQRRTADSSGDEFPIPSGPATDLVDPIGSLNLGHLSLDDGGRSRYVGTTYWAYISHEINDLNQLLRSQNRSHESSPENTHTEINDPMTEVRDRRSVSADSIVGSPTFHGHSGSFQRSIIFPSSSSPPAPEESIEPEMLEHVPTRRQSHLLYRGFMSGVHAISPVLHPPTILKLYCAFWEWYDYTSFSGQPCPNASFIPLLYAIWYGGSVTVSLKTIKAEFNTSSRFTLSSSYSEEVTRWLTRISFPRSPSLHGLAAYLIVQTILSKEEEPLKSSLFVSLAMRVAQTMGLHRDPSNFGIEASEAEYRRRLWWHIMHMDGVVAMSSGLPPLVGDENYWDVRYPSEVKDTLLGTPLAEQYEKSITSKEREPDNPDDPSVCGGPSVVNVFYLTARGKYIMARAIRRILRIQLGIKPVTRSDMEELRTILLNLQSNLNSIVSRIPESSEKSVSPGNGNMKREPSFSNSPDDDGLAESGLPGEGPHGCTEQYHTAVLVSYHRWAKIMLSLYIDKAFCVAYQPFLKNVHSRIWPAARQSALRHCHGFMEKFIELATDPDFQPFQWSWPGNHQPMHATMIMLIDLYERPCSPEAARSRAFIDRILALSGPDGGVVGGEDGITTQRPLKDGGREAWDMIRRLRQKAWQKAGLNPQMFWTEQDQAHVSLRTPAEEANEISPRPVESNNSSVHCSSDPSSAAPPRSWSVALGRTPAEFNHIFYNLTRSHTECGQRSALSTSIPGTSQQDPYNKLPTPGRTSAPFSTPQNDPLLTAATAAELQPSFSSFPSTTIPPGALPLTAISAAAPDFTEEGNLAQYPSNSTVPPVMPFMDSTSLNEAQMGAPTPPSMVDPNLNFDWDQWDAVFGQHLPVADELMELDPVSGLDLANPSMISGPELVNAPFGANPNVVPPGSGSNIASPWPNHGQDNQQMSAGDWAGF